MRIDGEFEKLIPPLSKDEYEQLEKNCIEYGIRDEIIVAVYPDSNGEVLIDGHNRYKISMNNGGLAYKVKRIDFSSREKAMEWMILNQFGRRNLSTYDRSILALKLKPVIAERAKEARLEGNSKGGKSNQKSDETSKEVNTSKELATIAGVSHDTIHKVEVIQREAPEEAERIRTGETTINRVYNALKPSGSKKDVIRKAQQEHEAFEEIKSDCVVSINDAIKDKENVSILAAKFVGEIIGGTDRISNALFRANMRKYANAMCDSDKRILLSNLTRCEKVIEEIREYFKEG